MNVSINQGLFITICIFAGIGAIIVFLLLLGFIIYIIGAILDLTYHERHKTDNANKCPDFIDVENNKEE